MGFFYPPTEDQLRLINFADSFFSGDIRLWLLRVVSLILLIISLFFWFQTIKKNINKNIALISIFLIFLTPTFFILWYSHPFDCLKIFILLTVFYLMFGKSNEKRLLGFAVFSIIFISIFSFSLTQERSSFIHKLSLSDAQKELNIRFDAEDKVLNKVDIPLNLKRIAYNKYFILYKQLVNEIIPFFDFETIFFQEIHPKEQKSVVLFVWPVIFLFLFGIYFLFKKENKSARIIVLSLSIVALGNYLISINEPYRKFEMILFPISLVTALTINEGMKYGIGWIRKSMFWVCVVFLIYGTGTNYYDLFNRTDFWLDNRPIFYDYIFKTISKEDLEKYDNIYISSIVGNPELYCKFYRNDCQEKFTFKSFDLSVNKSEKKSLYAGFAGEFIGSDFKNNINSNWKNMISSSGINILGTMKMRDTIAYKYGNDVVIGEAK